MEFKKVFGGYDINQVDREIKKIKASYEDSLMQQKERIFTLVEENKKLSEQLKQFLSQEKELVESIVVAKQAANQVTTKSTKQAKQVTEDAMKLYEREKSRANVFSAAWQVYGQRIANCLSPEQLREFNALNNQISAIVNDGVEYANPIDKILAAMDVVAVEDKKKLNAIPNVTPNVIEMSEIYNVTESLEDLCKDLGIE